MSCSATMEYMYRAMPPLHHSDRWNQYVAYFPTLVSCVKALEIIEEAARRFLIDNGPMEDLANAVNAYQPLLADKADIKNAQVWIVFSQDTRDSSFQLEQVFASQELADDYVSLQSVGYWSIQCADVES